MKTIKEYNYHVQIVNIKLLSNNRHGDNAYREIITEIYKNKIRIPVRGGKSAILRTLFTDTYEGTDVIYGKFSKFTVIDGDDWLNLENMEVENVEIPANKFPNLVESDYIFIPKAHRFAVILATGININAVAQFFQKSIPQILGQNEDFEVIIEQSEDVFEQIFNAEIVRKLFIRITYSNADTGNSAYKFMDNELKESNIGKLDISAIPDHNKNIHTNTTLISGALEVAKSNGYATATIIENGRRVDIDTQAHPKTLKIKSEIAMVKKKIFDKIIELYRNHDRS